MYHPAGTKDSLNYHLNRHKTHLITTLTLYMVYNTRESIKITFAATIWAVIELLLVNRGAKVLIQ